MKSKSAILAAAGGSHEAAFEALYADYANSIKASADLQEQLDNAGSDGGSLRNRVIAKALAPLAEALGIELPVSGQKPPRDAEQTIAEQVQNVLSGLQELETGLESARELLTDAGLDLEALEGDDGEQAVQTWLDSISETATLRETVERQRAAAALGVSEAELAEWLGERKLTSSKVKDGDGKDVDAYGLTVKGTDGKDTFKPLTDFQTFQKLTSQQHQQQTPSLQFPQQRLPVQQPQQVNVNDRAAQIAAEGRGTI